LGKSDRKIGFYGESYPLYLTIVYGKLSYLRSKVPIKFGINYFGQYNSLPAPPAQSWLVFCFGKQ
jgi:hypothetical protein